MNQLKLLKTKIEAELKNKNPSVDKIVAECEKVCIEYQKEIEKQAIRIRSLEKTLAKTKFSGPRTDFRANKLPKE